MNVSEVATTESRRKGALRAAEVKRERGKSVRQRLAERAEQEVESIVGVYLDAMAADGEHGPDHQTRLKAAQGLLEQAFGRPQTIEVEVSGPEGEPIQVEGRAIVGLADVVAFAREIGAGHLLGLDTGHSGDPLPVAKDVPAAGDPVGHQQAAGSLPAGE